MKYILMVICLTLLFMANTEISADKVYTWTDAKGNLHVTQHPPPQNAKTKDVMNYQPQTEAQIRKIEAEERREEMQDETALQKETRPRAPKTGAASVQQDDDETYIDREGKIIRRHEAEKEMRDQRQNVRRGVRFHRR
ncbi:MAG: DUF4124 domain-containing protein [Deltaproteobacteria bacterium]|jgi:phage protein D|nr:DUF4124 domain-containing protein [Deltaproteobacteria bacterium]